MRFDGFPYNLIILFRDTLPPQIAPRTSPPGLPLQKKRLDIQASFHTSPSAHKIKQVESLKIFDSWFIGLFSFTFCTIKVRKIEEKTKINE